MNSKSYRRKLNREVNERREAIKESREKIAKIEVIPETERTKRDKAQLAHWELMISHAEKKIGELESILNSKELFEAKLEALNKVKQAKREQQEAQHAKALRRKAANQGGNKASYRKVSSQGHRASEDKIIALRKKVDDGTITEKERRYLKALEAGYKDRAANLKSMREDLARAIHVARDNLSTIEGALEHNKSLNGFGSVYPQSVHYGFLSDIADIQRYLDSVEGNEELSEDELYEAIAEVNQRVASLAGNVNSECEAANSRARSVQYSHEWEADGFYNKMHKKGYSGGGVNSSSSSSFSVFTDFYGDKVKLPWYSMFLGEETENPNLYPFFLGLVLLGVYLWIDALNHGAFGQLYGFVEHMDKLSSDANRAIEWVKFSVAVILAAVASLKFTGFACDAIDRFETYLFGVTSIIPFLSTAMIFLFFYGWGFAMKYLTLFIINYT